MTQRVSNLVHRIREFLQDERADGLPVRTLHVNLVSLLIRLLGKREIVAIFV